jgi:hypothetical protein
MENETRTYRPLTLTPDNASCLICGKPLKISQHRERTVTGLEETLWLTMRDKKCTSPECPQPHLRFRSPEESRIVLPNSSFGLDVVLDIGYKRFHEGMSFPRIHSTLMERGFPICPMAVQYQARKYEALVGCQVSSPNSPVFAKLRERGFLLPIIDAVQYGGGEAVVYLIIDGLSGIPLFGWETRVRGKIDLVPFIGQLKTLDLPIIGMVSDKETGLAPAIAEALPGVPHQFCQRHYLSNVAKPLEKDLALLGEEIRAQEEELRGFQRDLIRLEAKAKSDGKPVPADLETAREFCDAARAAARCQGRETTDPPALKRHKEVGRVEKAVLKAVRKKGGTGNCSTGCGRSFSRQRRRVASRVG